MDVKWKGPGNVRDTVIKENRVLLKAENCDLELNILKSDLIQVKMMRPDEEVFDSIAIYKKEWQTPELSVNKTDKYLEIVTDKLRLEIGFRPYRLKVYNSLDDLILADEEGPAFAGKDAVRVRKSLTKDEKFYGLGERTGFLNKRGEEHELWNVDQSTPHVHSTRHMYKTIPFLIGLKEKKSYGIFFDNTYRSRFDLGKNSEDYFSFEADGGPLNYYIFYGPSIETVVQHYTELTGRMEMPPKWAVGFQQCRYSYYPETKVRDIANKFREKEIPCDVIYLDIDYMDGYRVFTWDQAKFPQPEKMLADLKEDGFKVVNIVDPGVKQDDDYFVYQEAIDNNYLSTDKYGIPFIGTVWPGDSVFPDFSQSRVREWWGEKNKDFIKSGIAGIWNDMNEPALLEGETQTMPLDIVHENDGREIDHAEFHNLYGTYMTMGTREGLLKARPNERPFILTRSGFSGIQRYAAAWTGDNKSFWEHLALSIPMLTNLGISGLTFAGADIGGFGFEPTPELFARWIQLGICYPFCRVHSAIDTMHQEPWTFGPRIEEIAREYISLRYQLMPYLYNQFYQAAQTGQPIMQPLIYQYQDDEKVHNINDQFMLGESIMVAPVIQPGKDCRAVYLPAGEWYDFHTGLRYEGEKSILADAPLDKMPIFVKAGSMVPMRSTINYIGEKELEELIIQVYSGPDMEYTYYEDDGHSYDYLVGGYNLTRFEVQTGDKVLKITIEPLVEEFDSSIKRYKFILKDMDQYNRVLVNGEEVEVDREDDQLVVSLPVEHI